MATVEGMHSQDAGGGLMAVLAVPPRRPTSSAQPTHTSQNKPPLLSLAALEEAQDFGQRLRCARVEHCAV